MTSQLPSRWFAGLLAVLCFVSTRADVVAPAKPDVGALLSEIEAKSPKEWVPASIAENNIRAVALVESNQLVTAVDFQRAGRLLSRDFNDYRIGRCYYELLLASAGKDGEINPGELATTWDFLLNKIGRPVRFDINSLSEKNPEFFDADPAPACIRAVWLNPGKALAALAEVKDNPEIKSLVDADQADRQVMPVTDKDRTALMARDRQRLVRMKEIIAAGDIHTTADFRNSALVMQHSPKPAGIQLAHELAVCSLLLGDRGMGRWLVAASYDRFLRQLGHDQRFGTQFGMNGLERVDESGICDNERLALGCPTLEQARNRQKKL